MNTPKWYACDFETHIPSDLNDGTYVWAWGSSPVKENDFSYGTSILSFFEYCVKQGSGTYWFHNEKFDGVFIVDFLLRNGYVYVDKPSGFEMNDGEFSALINGQGQYYVIKVKIGEVVLKFCNSLLKIPGSIADIARSLKLEVSKGEIDYNKERQEFADDLEEDDLEYLKRDVEILRIALLKIHMENGLTKMTIGSDCLANYKKMIGARFKSWFPELPKDVDKFIRESYRGGYVWKKPNVFLVMNGNTYDYNSMYPSVMHSGLGYKFPYGEPVYYEGLYEYDELYPLFVQRFKCSFKLKHERWPTINSKGMHGFLKNEYLTESIEQVELTLTSVDFDWFFKNYDVQNLVFLDGYKFKGQTRMFDKYINKWFDAKKNNDDNPTMRTLAKLFLNNLYGKFGTNPIGYKKIPYLDKELDILKYTKQESEIPSVYIPVACFATAYARNELFKGIESNWCNFCYCDTDSLHLSGEAVGLNINKVNLGAWKHESSWTIGKFLRAKTYMECVEGHWDIKCAGMPKHIKAKIKNEKDFYIGAEFEGKLIPKIVKGGVVLVETTFVIKQ